MKNKKELINQVLYRSTHRGTKEMDLLLGNFVKKYISTFNDKDLSDLYNILNCDDDVLYKWYFSKIGHELIPINKVTQMLRDFKI